MGELLQTYYVDLQRITSVAFSPDTHFLLTGGWDYSARLWAINVPK